MEPSLLPIEILEAQQDFPEALAACGDLDALLRLKGAYIGREGSHAARLMELLKAAPKEQKRELGAAINALKNAWEEALKARQAELEDAKKRTGGPRRAPGIRTCRRPCRPRGALHPLNRLIDRLVDVFRPLGYHVEEGPEIETEAHNFDGLNIPAGPSRARQRGHVLLREASGAAAAHPHEPRAGAHPAAPGAAHRGEGRHPLPGARAASTARTRSIPPTAPCSTRWKACWWATASACIT